MIKKLFGAILAATIFAGCFLGLVSCGNKTAYDASNFLTEAEAKELYGDSRRIVKEPVTIKVFVPKSSLNPDYNELISMKELSRVTNIKFDFIEADVGAYDSLRTVTWENKDELPDLFLYNNPLSEQMTYAPLGALVAFNDDNLTSGGVKAGNLIDNYMPVYKDLLNNDFYAANPQVSAKSVVTLSDGKMYATVACNDIPRDRTFKMYLNQKWIDDLNEEYSLGLKNQPETIDEYITVLKAFRDYDANHNGIIDDEIPLSALSLHLVRYFILCAYGYTSNGIEIEDDFSKFTYVPKTDNYREYLKTMNYLYKEKLLDNGTFEMNAGSQLAGKGYDNRLGSWADAAAYLTVGKELEDDYTSFGPLTSNYSDKKLAYALSEMFSASGAVIPNGTPYVREIARLLDLMYSDWGSSLMAVGVEGDNWEWIDEEHTEWKFNIPSSWTGTNEEYRALISPSVGTGCALFAKNAFDEKQVDVTLDKINEEVKKYIPYIKQDIPDGFKMTTSQYNSVSNIIANLDVYRDTMEARFIKGTLDPSSDKDWNEYVSKLKQYKCDELEKIYNEALKDNNLIGGKA